MNVEVYRSWFIVGTLTLMLLAATPTLTVLVHLPKGSERFSELWLLGPGHEAKDYPFNVRVNETYSVYVAVENRLGYFEYYRIYAKIRNQTQPLPMGSNTTPSMLPALYEFRFFVRDNRVHEILVNFRIVGTERFSNFLTLSRLMINNVTFRVDSLSQRDEVRNGFYFQLFFELWLHNATSQGFQYHNRYVTLWLNVTAS